MATLPIYKEILENFREENEDLINEVVEENDYD